METLLSTGWKLWTNLIKSLSLFLCFHFLHAFSFPETKAAEYAASMMKSDQIVNAMEKCIDPPGAGTFATKTTGKTWNSRTMRSGKVPCRGYMVNPQHT